MHSAPSNQTKLNTTASRGGFGHSVLFAYFLYFKEWFGMTPDYFYSAVCHWRCLGFYVFYGMIGLTFIFPIPSYVMLHYICKTTDTMQFSIRQFEFFLTMPFETIMKVVNINCPSEVLFLIPYNFINLNPSRDQIFQFI